MSGLLKSGRIDIIMPASEPVKASSELSFTTEDIMTTYHAIMTKKNRGDLYYDDYNSIYRMKIAITKQLLDYVGMKSYLKSINVYKNLVYYDDYNECKQALDDEKVDGVISNVMDLTGDMKILNKFSSPNLNSNHSLVGDLSAILIQNVNPLINFIRVPSKKIALMSEWETKIEAIANSTIPVNVTSLSGVPSWMLVLIKRVLEKTGKQALEEVWPNLEVFFHGGVAFTPYREQYKQVIQTPKMHYVETYNASEGYFGTQNDLSDPAMLLMIDYGIFYEFVPLEEVGKESPRAYCLEEVELNKNYAMVISTSCGLWRYMIGDTVKFTSKNPYKFVITGRTKHFINAFGEELIVDNAEKGLAKACAETGAQVSEYTAAPVFMDENAKCRHQWLIEFAKMPDSVEKFAAILDATLKEVNSDYEAKRWKDIALQPLEVIVAREGLFHDWLAQKGKLGGQHKVPRLSNTREYIETMLALNDSIPSEE